MLAEDRRQTGEAVPHVPSGATWPRELRRRGASGRLSAATARQSGPANVTITTAAATLEHLTET